MAIPSTADIFQAKSESLVALLPEIHDHKVALPNFQREWVWEPSLVKDLIVSVANRYPAGSLLTMPNSGDTFALRPFSGSGQHLSTTPTLMVLDGQQRLTSLYQALYSRDGVKDAKGVAHYLYLDVTQLTDHSTNDSQQESVFENCLYVVPVNRHGQRLRYTGLRTHQDLSTRDLEIKHGALPLTTVFAPDDLNSWRDRYIQQRADRDYDRLMKLREEWDMEVAPWISRIRDYRFPVIELNRNMQLHAICHIFEKVNSTGVALTVFELCTAILWAQGLRLNSDWEAMKRRFDEDQVLRMQVDAKSDLEGAMFLQVISLLATLDRKRSNPDARMAVNCRREDLLNLDARTVTHWWEVAAMGYRDASRFMEAQGIVAHRVLPYSTLLLPLAAIMGYRRYQGASSSLGAVWPKVERWYWCSVFAQRYSSSVETTAALDFEQVITWIEGGDEPEAVRTFSFPADRLQSATNIRNAIYKGVLCLLARNGARDFGGEGTLSINLYYDTQQDHHHIVPLNALRNLDIEDARSSSIVNKTLIGASANRSIGGRLPSAYVQTMIARMGEERTHAILRSHLIDPATLLADAWEDFFLSRREELKELIHTTCGGQMQEFSDGKRVSLPRQVERLTAHVSDIELRLRTLVVSEVSEWNDVPSHIRDRVDLRIEAEQRANPGTERSRFATVAGRLPFCDLRNLEEIIISKPLWPRFVDMLGSKERLSSRFSQLAPLRNAHAHLREIDDLTRSDAEAAVIWFSTALTRVERLQDAAPTQIPVKEAPEREIAAVSLEAFDTRDVID